MDVSVPESVDAAVASAWARQPVDVLLLSAGSVRMGLTEDLPLAHVQEQVRGSP